jgi:sugar O-acyltransferase (sialic acid O-acetyltransferase NeuD family)
MKHAIIGSGGHSHEVRACLGSSLKRVFVDDEYYFPGFSKVFPLSQFDPSKYDIMIAIGSSRDRAAVESRLPANTKFFSFRHSSVIQMAKDVSFGVGSYVGAGSILTTNVIVGSHALLVRGANVGHDCVIGDFFSAMPGVVISSRNYIGHRVFIGANASTREGVSICNDVIVGMGAAVVKDIDVPGVYVGVPAKRMRDG